MAAVAAAGSLCCVPAVIECHALTKRYGRNRGIEALSLRVEPGEVFGFLGPNGAGKTTTIRTLLDFHRPTAGRATVFGLDCRRDSIRIRARVGNLPGDFALEPHLTGQRALELFAALRGVRDLRRAHSLAERFDADLARPVGTLSRGNRQKVGLILALFHDPDLLVLDEPTSGLDPLMQEEFLAVIGECRDRGGTVFLSSHELDEVQRICDRVAVIRDGRLVATEGVEAMRQRAYRKVSVRLAPGAAAERFRTLAGVADLEREGDELRFRIRGELAPLLRELAQGDVRDVELTRPSLDELFLGYYRDEASA